MNKNMFTQDQLNKVMATTATDGNRYEPLINAVRRAHKRRRKEGKHTRLSRTTDGRKFTWHETKPLPEDVKARNRKKTKAKKKQQKKARNK